MHGQPLSKAVMVACAQNRGPALHILLHHTPSISEMIVRRQIGVLVAEASLLQSVFQKAFLKTVCF